jgi:acetate kinase
MLAAAIRVLNAETGIRVAAAPLTDRPSGFYQERSTSIESTLMNILVLNSGSSSIKFQVFDMQDPTQPVVKGMAGRIAQKESFLSIQHASREPQRRELPLTDHRVALKAVFESLREHLGGDLENAVQGIGHRIVHGGAKFSVAIRIDPKSLQGIKDVAELAPLHNRPSILGIEACQTQLSGVPNVAVFDTALHRTMPRKAYLYGLPIELCEAQSIRKYGFHGINHGYAAQEAARLVDRPMESLRIISCHLGNGCSVTALDAGKSVDTSMGFTPLEGVMMGTRCGDIDPSVVLYLARDMGLGPDEIERLLNERSGLRGLCGVSDMRDVLDRADQGDARACAAVDVFVYRIQKYIGAFTATLHGVNAIVLTGGIGENSPYLRQQILQPFEYLGLRIDAQLNARNAPVFSTSDSAVYAVTVPANEELAIARETYELVTSVNCRS